MHTPESVRKALVSFGVPEWASFPCPSCRQDVPPTSALSIGIELSPTFHGNLTVTSVCPNCDSLCEMHYEDVFAKMPDLGFNKAEKVPVSRPEIIKRGVVKIAVH